MKYILVTGGVQSGIGKGVIASSIGALLKACNLRVTAIKIDPYINIDAGTFSPYEHGEVFVLDDGCEVDLDLGNYERFLETRLHGKNNITTGKIFQTVFDRVEQGKYSEEIIKIDNHVIDCIQEWIHSVARVPSVNDLAQIFTSNDIDAEMNSDELSPDVCIIELGGTAGDIEGVTFIEALTRLKYKVQSENFCCIHVTLVGNINGTGSTETEPTKGGVRRLQNFGLRPDLIVCRSEEALSESIIDIISRDCTLDSRKLFNLRDFQTIYMVPRELEKQGLIKALADCLKLQLEPTNRIQRWDILSKTAVNATEEVVIGLVGKYTAFRDCYTSVIKAVEHACYSKGWKPCLRYIESSLLIREDTNHQKYTQAWSDLKSSHGLLVPGAFGYRGVEGIITAINWARTNRVPFLGICLGFQAATIEYARNVLGLEDANSAEFKPDCSNPIVIEMLEYQDPEKKMGGTMRLGSRKTVFVSTKSILRKLYGDVDAVYERHRHRYEINSNYVNQLEASGLRFVGRNVDGDRMEVLELDESVHPFYVAVQYHPEYLTRPFKPSPPYLGLVEASREMSKFKLIS